MVLHILVPHFSIFPIFSPIVTDDLFRFLDPYPSTILQEQIQSLLLSESETAVSFLNSVLNQLNWAFSEFIGMLQEV